MPTHALTAPIARFLPPSPGQYDMSGDPGAVQSDRLIRVNPRPFFFIRGKAFFADPNTRA
jgi:hypothetical protein